MAKEFYKNNWISIYTGFKKANFRIGPASYFSDRAHISITPTIIIPLVGIFFTGLSLWSLIWIPFFVVGYGSVYLDLPIHSGLDECEPPEYGYYFYGENNKVFTSFWWCWRKKKYAFYMPWDWDWVRTSTLLKDNTWFNETKNNKLIWFTKGTERGTYDWLEKNKYEESHLYTYILRNGEIQNRIATLKVEEREWRWRGFKWLPFPRMIRKDIQVNFSYGGPIDREVIVEKINCPLKKKDKYTGEIGERTGSWKGGTTGCGYSMLPGESPEQTLKRMEKERVFN